MLLFDFAEIFGRVFLAKAQLNIAGDLLVGFSAVDVALLRSGQFSVILHALHQTFRRVMLAKLTESGVVAALIMSGKPFLVGAVRHSIAYPFLQDFMFALFPIARAMRWAGSKIYPLRLQRVAKFVTGAFLENTVDEWQTNDILASGEVSSADGSMGYWSGNYAKDGTILTVAKCHFVSHLCTFVAEQVHWIHEYRAAFRKGLSYRRTLKTHIGSTIFRFSNVLLTFAARIIGSRLGHYVYPHRNAGWFYGQHRVALAAFPVISIVADKVAFSCFNWLETVLPSSAEDAAEDVREEEETQHEENDAREHYDVLHNARGDSKDNLYAVLGVKEAASQSEIRKAYRALALTYHPDKVAAEPHDVQVEAAQAMAKLNYAYDVLSSEGKRRLYDSQRTRDDPPVVVQQLTRLPRPIQFVGAVGIVASASNLAVLVSYIHLGALFKKFTMLGDLRP